MIFISKLLYTFPSVSYKGETVICCFSLLRVDPPKWRVFFCLFIHTLHNAAHIQLREPQGNPREIRSR